jgi:hypothetical protein
MPRKNTSRVEILSASEAVLVPRPTAENLQAAIDRMVRERVDAILAEHGAALLEPDFQSREVSYEIQRRQTVFERRRWSLYFEKWGCRRCDRKTVSHVCGGYCDRCHNLLFGRLVRIKREFDAANPDKEMQRNIDRLTRRLRSAQELLEPPRLPPAPETSGLSPGRCVRAYRKNNVAAGKCTYCPRPLAPNSIHYCEECLRKKREGKRKRREEFKARLRAALQGGGEK